MKYYNINLGKGRNDFCDLSTIYSSHNFGDALINYRIIIDKEQKQIKGWNLYKDEMVIIELLELDDEDDNYYDVIEKYGINKKGEIIFDFSGVKK